MAVFRDLRGSVPACRWLVDTIEPVLDTITDPDLGWELRAMTTELRGQINVYDAAVVLAKYVRRAPSDRRARDFLLRLALEHDCGRDVLFELEDAAREQGGDLGRALALDAKILEARIRRIPVEGFSSEQVRARLRELGREPDQE